LQFSSAGDSTFFYHPLAEFVFVLILPSAGQIKMAIPLYWGFYIFLFNPPLAEFCFVTILPSAGQIKNGNPPPRGILHFYSTIRWPNLFCDNPSLRRSDKNGHPPPQGILLFFSYHPLAE
jgi:hypothetical protein